MKALVNKGIVHRDLKPQNILLSYDSRKINPPASEITLKIGKFHITKMCGINYKWAYYTTYQLIYLCSLIIFQFSLSMIDIQG